MRSRAKIFNEPHSFVLTNLKFFKLFAQIRVPRGACINYVTLDKCRHIDFLTQTQVHQDSNFGFHFLKCSSGVVKCQMSQRDI